MYIIGIYDVSVDESAYYIVVAYIRGGKTLKLFTKADALVPIEKVIEIIFKCTKALDYPHKQGVIPRDI